jgi:hypothetical protein
MDDTELESVTSTMSTSEGNDENNVNRNVKSADGSPMHQWMHQPSETENAIGVAISTLSTKQQAVLLAIIEQMAAEPADKPAEVMK